MAVQTNAPTAKVGAATGGAALGTAAAQIFVWVLNSHTDFKVDETIKPYLITVVTAIFTFAAGWIKSPGNNEAIITKPNGKPATARN